LKHRSENEERNRTDPPLASAMNAFQFSVP
jgi:hypothetical protein